MPLKQDLTKFSTQSPVIASFDFNDIADGTGVVVLKPFVARDTAQIHRMDSRTNSTEIIGVGATVNTSKLEKFNLDFDTKKFNLPRTVDGTALVRLPIGIQPGVSNQTTTVSILVNIYKWDGTTETLIGSTTALDRVSDVGAGLSSTSTLVEVDCSATYIPLGEQVRLNVVIDAQITGGDTNTAQIGIGHDPESNTFTFNTLTMTDTLMELNLPFRIE